MRVVLIYRKASTDRFSIEELFHTVAAELAGRVDIIKYEAGDRRRLFWDVWKLRRLNADVYHVTGDIHYFILLLPRNKTVNTVHDIRHYQFGLRGFKRWLYKWIWLILPIKRAGAVTSVSAETRDNIVKHLGIAGKRIEVIENCFRPIFRPSARPFAEECPIVLQVGTARNKNVPRVIEALNGLKCRLVLVGRLDEEITRTLEENKVDYENHVSISNEELYKRYVECDVVSFVSIGEGFGVPIIEAQAVGRPVIAANIPPMSEVAGDGACLVDPLDVGAIREGFRRVFTDYAYRDQMVKSGFENVDRFCPALISARYLALYDQLKATPI